MKTKLFTIIILNIILMSFAHADDVLGYQGENNEGMSPESLLSKLKSDGETEIRIDRNWTVATSKKLSTIWSFPPGGHPAYPSYVKREVVEKEGSVFMQTSVRCGAEKTECDKLVQDFIDLNKKVQNELKLK